MRVFPGVRGGIYRGFSHCEVAKFCGTANLD